MSTNQPNSAKYLMVLTIWLVLPEQELPVIAPAVACMYCCWRDLI